MGDNLKEMKMDASSQITNELLGIGNDTWVSVAELEQEHDPKPFFTAVRKFYVASVKKMLNKFRLGIRS